jgi:P-type Cu2+ transporter
VNAQSRLQPPQRVEPAAGNSGAADLNADARAAAPPCRHCGAPAPAGSSFCCNGCEAAYDLVAGLGLDAYYRRRTIDPRQPLPKPDDDTPIVDYAFYARDRGDGVHSLSMLVEGLHCAACVWLIESVLARQPGIVSARINMTTRRLQMAWRASETTPERLAETVRRLGYRLIPFDARCLGQSGARDEQELLRAMAVAGFAAGNVMLLSVSIWAGQAEGMGPATRTFLHWMSALVALPAIAYAGRPFFRGAWAALCAAHVTMDVPIALGVLLAAAMSLHETIAGAEHAYFDAAVSLLFFLLIGRYLDRRARGRARSAAEHLLGLFATAVTVVDRDGSKRILPPVRVQPGMHVLAAMGERIGVDGRVIAGESSVDTSLIDGESTPKPTGLGTLVFAGTLNVGAPLTIEVTATGDDTLLAEITRQVELAEQQRDRYVVLADRVAKLYAPFVHSAALVTFALWWGALGAMWQAALLNAIAVLIITCPCALGLAVPVVQVIASGRLLRGGILLKSPSALERLSEIDTIVFDKTGTLTEGRPDLLNRAMIDDDALHEAASLAAASRHPLARALVRACEADGIPASTSGDVREIAGRGLERTTPVGPIRLGSRAFCGIADDTNTTTTANAGGTDTDLAPELWLTRPAAPPVRFAFADALRVDAAEVIGRLAARGYRLALLSGDRAPLVESIAKHLHIAEWHAALRPQQKVERLASLAGDGRGTLMVGDGLNDAPALAAAHASMSPSSAIDVSQTAADLVFQGSRLAPVEDALWIALRARSLVRQNLALSFGYNLFAVPLAIAGQVTPLLAAVLMSTSSILVIVNALRLNRERR